MNSLQPASCEEDPRINFHRSGLSCWSALKIAAAASTLPSAALAGDLIFDTGTHSVSGGSFEHVSVLNDAKVTINGDISAANFLVAGTNCAVTVNGAVSCASFNVQQGSATVTGATNTVGMLLVNDRLVALGNWSCGDLHVGTNGTVTVYAINGTVPGSGQLRCTADNILIEAGGKIDGIGAGRDARGEGHCWYADSAGGGHVGIGGCGYWNSSRGGNEGQPYGTAWSYEFDMGGGGGANGGAGVCLESRGQLQVAGDVLCDGGQPWGSVGGGAGGTVLLHGDTVVVSGVLSARGAAAVGGSGGGGGSGGRVKVFYHSANLAIDMSKVFVDGGAAGGYLNTLPGAAGEFFRDQLAAVTSLASPANAAVIGNGRPQFEFTVQDFSAAQDGHRDALSPRIELSRDGFQNIAYSFSQDQNLAGWDKPLYYSGDTVRFTPPLVLPNGTYQWRVVSADGSNVGATTAPRTFTVAHQDLALTHARAAMSQFSFDIENGSGPFQLYDAPSPNGPWNTIGAPSAARQISVPYTVGTQRYFKVGEPGLPAAQVDQITDGRSDTVPAGVFNALVVKNSGSLQVTGAVTTASQIYLDGPLSKLGFDGDLVVDQLTVTGGTLSVAGHLKAQRLIIDGSSGALNVSGALEADQVFIKDGAAAVLGTNNIVSNLALSHGSLSALGNWSCGEVLVTNSSTVSVCAYSGTIAGSGQLKMVSDHFLLEAGSTVNGIGAGRDPRGEGHCWYADSAGGGHVGIGGCGYWDSSRGGNEGQPYGTAWAYVHDMGGGGGSNGGAGVWLESHGALEVYGDVLCDGGATWGSVGGGAGGTVLLHGDTVTIAGTLSARGASAVGGSGGGGGSGGRIKVFYHSSSLAIDMSKVHVDAGSRGGYLNTRDGTPGEFFRDHVTAVGGITSPVNGAQVSNGRPVFSFTLSDLSGAQDSHTDVLSPRIEISRDGFKTIAYQFDHDVDLSGWDKPLYYTGDRVTFTAPVTLVGGAYQWRVAARDVSLYGLDSAAQSFNVGQGGLKLTHAAATGAGAAKHFSFDIENGSGPFQLYDAPTPAGPWNALSGPSTNRHVDVVAGANPQRYFKVSEAGVAAARHDLITDSVAATAAAGLYDDVIVKNGGSLQITGAVTTASQLFLDGPLSKLTIDGDLTVDELTVHAGKLSIGGKLKAQKLVLDGANGAIDLAGALDVAQVVIKDGAMSARGTNNLAGTVQLSHGTLTALGVWSCQSAAITNASTLSVYPISGTIPGSGQLRFATTDFLLDAGSAVNGVGAGRDARGEGHCWYADSAGGGHVGIGGCGYWDSSRGGNEGQPYGSTNTYEFDMGGGGGSNGGAGVCLESTGHMVLSGSVSCEGGAPWGSVGGGAGGTILIKAQDLTIGGSLSVRGASAVGGSGGGGGSGGRVKIFYGQPTLSIDMSKMHVEGGARGGYLNTRDGSAGSFYSEHFAAW